MDTHKKLLAEFFVDYAEELLREANVNPYNHRDLISVMSQKLFNIEVVRYKMMFTHGQISQLGGKNGDSAFGGILMDDFDVDINNIKLNGRK